jgi:hypothetical protein
MSLETRNRQSSPTNGNGNGALKAQRELAKQGLAASLAALVLTGLSKTYFMRYAHVVAGLALIGLSLWHNGLYKSKTGKNS